MRRSAAGQSAMFDSAIYEEQAPTGIRPAGRCSVAQKGFLVRRAGATGHPGREAAAPTRGRFQPLRDSSTASTSSSCVFGDAFGMTCLMQPSASITNVARCAPMYVRPYIDFCTHTP